jgi:hypothetical protein
LIRKVVVRPPVRLGESLERAVGDVELVDIDVRFAEVRPLLEFAGLKFLEANLARPGPVAGSLRQCVEPLESSFVVRGAVSEVSVFGLEGFGPGLERASLRLEGINGVLERIRIRVERIDGPFEGIRLGLERLEQLVLGTALSPALFGVHLLETRIVGLLAAAFEPLEPPADGTRTDKRNDEIGGENR